MIAKWEKKGEHAYKGFIYFPEDNKKTRKSIDTKYKDEKEEEQISWWNPLTWFYYN